MEVNATFIGADGSLGFRHGERYRLTLAFIFEGPDIVKSGDMRVRCPYASWGAFFDNWKDVSKIKQSS